MLKYDVVVQFVVQDVEDRAKAEARVRKMLDGIPTDANVDIIQVTPNNQEKLYAHLEKELGVKKDKIAKAVEGFKK